MRVLRGVPCSQTLGAFAPFEVRLEIDQTVDHGSDPVTLHSRALNQLPHLSREIFSKVPALSLQSIFRLLQFAGWTLPRPIYIVVSDRDQNEIGKSLRRQQLANLSGEIARPQNSPKKILPLVLVIDERADARVFHRDKRRKLVQSLRNAPNARA
jgi:hypothetical protein